MLIMWTDKGKFAIERWVFAKRYGWVFQKSVEGMNAMEATEYLINESMNFDDYSPAIEALHKGKFDLAYFRDSQSKETSRLFYLL